MISKTQTFISILLAATLFLAVASLTEIMGMAQPRPQSRAVGVVYECPMHPEVTSRKRGRCSKCGMTLQSRKEKKTPDASDDTGSNGSTVKDQPHPDMESPSASAARYFPNLVLHTQNNQALHFYDDLVKGKVVLINFIFTTCQGVCSPMTANLARAQSYLAEHLDKEVVMISISVDPLTDTPEVLKNYAEKFKVKSGWYFLTGEKKNVDSVLYKLGGYVTDKQQHTSVLIIGNDVTGEWLKLNAMASPTDIASLVTKLLASRPDTATP